MTPVQALPGFVALSHENHKIALPQTAKCGFTHEKCKFSCKFDVAPYSRSARLRAPLHHLEPEVGGARCVDRANLPQFDPLRVEILEKPDAAAEKDGDEADMHLVKQPSLHILPDDVRATLHQHVLVADVVTGHLQCGLDPTL